MAILNSAKKAMDKVKTVRDARNSPHKATPDRRPVHKAARGPSDSDENRTITVREDYYHSLLPEVH